ncbi:MAG: EVE domain-containing protein [Planctomycetota bacterium]|nr:EVE domain-containing protein [Planctomycetota bacterium]
MPTFLLKTEPGEYSYDDLVREKRCAWTGVTNAAARIALRAMKKGDEAFIYHTGEEKAIVGLATVVRGAYEDPDEPGLNGKGEIAAPVVDLAPARRAASPVTLAQMKGDPRFAAFALVRQGRLSAMPVPPELDAVIRSLAGLEAARGAARH